MLQLWTDRLADQNFRTEPIVSVVSERDFSEFGTVRPRIESRAPTRFRMQFASGRCVAVLAFGAIGIAKRWANYSFDAVLIAAGGQSLLRISKAIFASDQIVETDSP